MARFGLSTFKHFRVGEWQQIFLFSPGSGRLPPSISRYGSQYFFRMGSLRSISSCPVGARFGASGSGGGTPGGFCTAWGGPWSAGLTSSKRQSEYVVFRQLNGITFGVPQVFWQPTNLSPHLFKRHSQVPPPAQEASSGLARAKLLDTQEEQQGLTETCPE